MNKLRIYIAAHLVCFGVILVSASFLYAKEKRTSTPAEAACDVALSKCWDFCDGTKDSTAHQKCDQTCIEKWSRCMDKAGIAHTNPPKKPIRPSSKPLLDKGPSTSGPAKPTPTPSKQVQPSSLKQAATPTPTPQKKQ